MQTESAVQVTSDHQPRRHARHGHLVARHAAVVAGVARREAGDGEQAGHLVYADGQLGRHGGAVPEPGHQHGRVALGHKASLAKALAFFKIIPEDKVLNFGCN